VDLEYGTAEDPEYVEEEAVVVIPDVDYERACGLCFLRMRAKAFTEPA
jgi:hypothetical protein